MTTDMPVRGRQTRAVRFQIDNFEEVGPVMVHVYTVPIEKGKNGEEVTEPFWIDGVDSFAVNLRTDHELPITIRAYRYPMDIGRTISKETKQIVDPRDKTTWPTVCLLRGAQACADRGFCIHEQAGQEPWAATNS